MQHVSKRTQLIREQQRSGTGEVTAIMVSRPEAIPLEPEEEYERCEECGHTPETGACFFCRMD